MIFGAFNVKLLNSPVGVDVDADLSDVGVDLADLVALSQVLLELVHRDLGEEDAVPHAHLRLAPVHLEAGDVDDARSKKFLQQASRELDSTLNFG